MKNVYTIYYSNLVLLQLLCISYTNENSYEYILRLVCESAIITVSCCHMLMMILLVALARFGLDLHSMYTVRITQLLILITAATYRSSV